jgi:[methyl-Co(III) methanol-specific corrinoid protein]:coenzyme M methyltransferase
MSAKKLMEFSPRRRVFATLLGEKVDKTPVTSIAGCGGTVNVDMQKTVGIYWPTAHKDAKKMAKLAIASNELSGLENVRVPFDFVIEPEALGCEITWGEKPDELPSTLGHPYKTPEDLKKPENLLEMGRIPVVLEAIRILKREVGDSLPICSTVLAPFTLAGEMAGLTDFIIWPIKEPEKVKKFVEFATEITIEYAKAQYEAGSDIINVADPTAGLIGPMFKDFAKPYLKRVTDNLRGVKVLHICGRTDKILKDMSETGFDGLSIEVEDIAVAKSIVGDAKVLGNISSSKTLFFGKPEEVKAEARKALKSSVDLLEPNCGISPVTPLENIKAMVEARNEYYSSKR